MATDSVDLDRYLVTALEEQPWSLSSTDILEDIQRAFEMLRNERWICKVCAFERLSIPTRLPTREEIFAEPRAAFVVCACPSCGSTDWYHTYEARPEV